MLRADLSFNNIELIEGLGALVNLTDLSLHNNHIKQIEGLDNLKKLETLSIGNNLLPSLEEACVTSCNGNSLTAGTDPVPAANGCAAQPQHVR